jgi:hypothetical protein
VRPRIRSHGNYAEVMNRPAVQQHRPKCEGNGFRVDGRGMRSRMGQWEIAYQGFAEGWYRIGSSEGSNPRIALQSWIERKGMGQSRVYGVRSPGEGAWQQFLVDASGVLHDHRGSETDEAHRAEEPSRAAGLRK